MSLRNRKLVAFLVLLASPVAGGYLCLLTIQSAWIADFRNPGWERWRFWANLYSWGAMLCVVLFIGATWYLVKSLSIPKFASGRCQGCGYDLTGNFSGRCPECGREITGLRNGHA